jgi:CheY-like chemotaxis protein
MKLFGIVLYLWIEQRLVMHKCGPIIIIEDDADDQELLDEIFKELKVANLLKFFNSCLQAFDYLFTTPEKPFLIISDINLPAMTGLELCKKITESNVTKGKNIPFIFLTTSNDRQSIAKAYEMPVQGFFVKPSSVDELKDMVRMILDYWNVCRYPYDEQQ